MLFLGDPHLWTCGLHGKRTKVPLSRGGTDDKEGGQGTDGPNPGKLRIEGLEARQTHLSSIALSLDINRMLRMHENEPAM